MKLPHILSAALLLTLSATSLHAQQPSSSQQEMERAIMQVYNEEIAQNPAAYEALYRRAAMYYNDGLYMRALQDVDNAIRYLPSEHTELRVAALSLRANIQLMQQQYAKALDDLVIANQLHPDDYILTYQLANAQYECGKYADAKLSYQRLRRLNPRSVEGLVGLSRVAIRENNLGLANDYIDQAVEIAPNNADTYLRRASVRRQLGNNAGAAQDYISALSLGDTSNSVDGLVRLADADYPATISAISEAVAQAPGIGLFYYLRGVIAMNHYHYRDALSDLSTLVDRQLYDYPGVYDAMAACEYALGQYEAALADASKALGAESSAATAPYMVTRARILLALGRGDEALEDAGRAHGLLPEDNDALVTMARATAATGDDAGASDLLGEAIFNNADIAANYLYRAHLLVRLNDRQGARNLYQRLADLTAADDIKDDARMLRGFALAGLGDTDGARAWADTVNAADDPHGDRHYTVACLYAALGDTDAALKALTVALDAGYADYDSLMRADDAPVTLAPLRGDARFTELINSYSSLF